MAPISQPSLPPTNPATPTPSPVPTLPPPVIPSTATFTTTTTTAIPAQTPPAAGATTAPVPLALPTGGGISGSVSLPGGSTIPAGTVAALTASTVIPQGLPALARKRSTLALRSPSDVSGAVTVVEYQTLVFDHQVVLQAQPAFTFTVPANFAGVTGVSYYMAAYDPLRSSNGWVHGFEGPGVVSGSTITFTGQSGPYVFAANSPQYFALYAVSASAATPTPAPVVSPAPTPAPIGFSPASVELTAIGATATVTVTDAATAYTAGYTATVADATIATATISGTTLTVTAVAPGFTSVTVASRDGRQVLVPVGVTTTTVPVQ